ncbi:MAG: ATP-binding cassette domain-containing protein [Lentisphaerae bacterium]|nr:MAG: ATP-binding cassette domain-containing protein [Lentisphaerota bacterium]
MSSSTITGEAPLLACELTKHYGDLIAVDRLSFHVQAGEIVGLLGPNGAGKTTALRMLAAILPPTSGTARIMSHDVTTQPLQVKQSLGFLSGGTALYKRLSPRELLRCFGRFYELPPEIIEARIGELSRELQMQEFLDQPCGTLSSGQQQKANIARTLIHDPPVLILDEPTTALDIITGRFLQETLRAARDRGKAILFSTHHMDTAEYLCNRIVLIYKGKTLASGTVEELLGCAEAENLTDAFLNLIERYGKNTGVTHEV